MAYPGGHGEYMVSKRAKLLEQSKVDVATSCIFKNMHLYFNGHTGQLTMLELKNLVTSHGAVVEPYLNRNVTHVIASQVRFLGVTF